MAAEILLLGLNARYRHTAFGLRCLMANLGELEQRAELMEATINDAPIELAEKILLRRPKVLGLSVAIWNVSTVEALLQILRPIAPQLVVVLGGPEVSHEFEGQTLDGLADYVIQGEGEQAFAGLCGELLQGRRPSQRIIAGTRPPMEALASPYGLYSDEDLRQRVVYVEASRGCPFRCAFCLSSLDRLVRQVPMDRFLADMQGLLDRGAKDFKFIDRTFNLSLPFALSVLDFFRQRLRPGLSLHFEMVPERLPPELIEALANFPPGVVQLEVGVQTFDAKTARTISRPMKIEAIETNLRALHEQTGVHLHVDLIAGLPGEGIASFAAGFDRLFAMGPHEIQLGILKRLKGTPVTALSQRFGMLYSPLPPFEVLQTEALSFAELQGLRRCARVWDLVVNSGQFPESSALLWVGEPSVFYAFSRFSDWLVERMGRSHIALLKLAEAMLDYLVEGGAEEGEVAPVLVRDLARRGGRRLPKRLQPYQHHLPPRPRATGGELKRRQAGHHRQTEPS